MVWIGRGRGCALVQSHSIDELPNLDTGFVPRRLQLELRQSLKRFNVIVCHRRFGKTVFAINHQIDKMVRNKNTNPRAAYLAPTYGQASEWYGII